MFLIQLPCCYKVIQVRKHRPLVNLKELFPLFFGKQQELQILQMEVFCTCTVPALEQLGLFILKT